MRPLPPPSTHERLESAAKRIAQLERELEEAKRTSVELFDHAKRWQVELGQAKTDRAKAESDLALSATRTYTLQSQLTAHKAALVNSKVAMESARSAINLLVLNGASTLEVRRLDEAIATVNAALGIETNEPKSPI